PQGCHARRAGDDSGDPGGGYLPRRHEAGHGPSADPLMAFVTSSCSIIPWRDGMPTKTTRTATKARKKARAEGSSLAAANKAELSKPIVPGEVLLGAGEIEAFKGRETRELTVANTGDRPIQVGSHCHFFEANRALKFDREKAFGFRLQVPAGTAVRFEPGEEKRVTLVAIGGNRVAYGINGLTNGKLDDPEVRRRALERAIEHGF